MREEEDGPGSRVCPVEAVNRVYEVTPVTRGGGPYKISEAAGTPVGCEGIEVSLGIGPDRSSVSILQVCGVTIVDDLPVVTCVQSLEPERSERIQMRARCKGGRPPSIDVEDRKELRNPRGAELDGRRGGLIGRRSRGSRIIGGRCRRTRVGGVGGIGLDS